MHAISRRQALQALSALFLLPAELPLNTPGLEHVGLTVPNPEETAKFYGRIFNPQLFRERDAPPRYYVTAGTAYMAFGGMANATPKIDHFCALVQDYKAQDMRKALEEQGLTIAGAGMIGDPDPFTAITNALQYFRVDDIVISTFSETKSGWLRADLIERVRRATDKPVEHVVHSDAETAAA